MAELSAKTKDQLLSGMSPMKYARYRNDKKDAIVRAAYSDMLTEFTLHKSLTYGMDGPEPARRRMVANMTEADLAEYASRVAERRKEIDEARKNYANALETRSRWRTTAPHPRQARRQNDLPRGFPVAESGSARSMTPWRRKPRRSAARSVSAEKTRIEAAQQKTGASIVETKMRRRA